MDRRGVGRVGSDAEEPNTAVAVSKCYLPDGLRHGGFLSKSPSDSTVKVWVQKAEWGPPGWSSDCMLPTQGTQVQALDPLKINNGKLSKCWQGTFPLIFFSILLIKSYL